MTDDDEDSLIVGFNLDEKGNRTNTQIPEEQPDDDDSVS